jgi:Fe-S oxidoreductase
MDLQTREIPQAELDKAREAIRAISEGPMVLQLYMDICAKCGTCAEQCHVSQADPDSRANPAMRSDRLRKVYNAERSVLNKVLRSAGLTTGDDLTAEDLRAWARDFYCCSGCRRCAKFCPMGIDNSVIMRKARSILHSIGLTPGKIRAILQSDDRVGNGEGVRPATAVEIAGFLERELYEEHALPIRVPIDQKAEVLFVASAGEILTYPETLMGCATFFHAAGIDWTLSSHAFDAANYGLFSGDDEHVKRKNKRLHDASMDLGVRKLVIGECGHAYRVATQIGGTNFWGKDIPYEITSIFVLAAEVIRRGGVKMDNTRNPMAVTYHDPCNYARSAGLIEEPREVLRACAGDFREMTPNRDYNWCCGGGGGLVALESSEGVSGMDSFYEYRMTRTGRKKLEQVDQTGAAYVAVPCYNCKRQIGQLMEHHRREVQVGSVFDLVGKAIVLKG